MARGLAPFRGRRTLLRADARALHASQVCFRCLEVAETVDFLIERLVLCIVRRPEHDEISPFFSEISVMSSLSEGEMWRAPQNGQSSSHMHDHSLSHVWSQLSHRY